MGRAASVRVLEACGQHKPSVFLTGHGEPLTHPAFLGQFTAIAFVGCKIKVQTNGQLFTSEILQHLLTTGQLDRLVVSIDGATKGTYEAIRRGARFNTLENNLAAFVSLRGPSKTPPLSFEFVAMRRNIHELPGVVSMAARYGADGVQVTDCQETTVNAGASLENEPEVMREWLGIAKKKADRHGIRLDLTPWQAGLVGHAEPWKAHGAANGVCRTPWHVAYVTASGHVQPCCRIPQSMGSLTEQSFDEIWLGERWRKLRAGIEAGNLPQECKECGWV
jgi:MoaA/NifB/PqqE/SkfB family radical SAM enzyme